MAATSRFLLKIVEEEKNRKYILQNLYATKLGLVVNTAKPRFTYFLI
jgi:hypothetical protein